MTTNAVQAPVDVQAATDKVVREVIRLQAEQPFFASFLLSAKFKPVKIGDKGGAVAMDGKTMYFDPEKVLAMDRKEIRWSMLTGAAKIGLGHHLRGAGYEQYELLVQDGVKSGWKSAWQKASEVAAAEIFESSLRPDGAMCADKIDAESDRPAEYYYDLIRHKPEENDSKDKGDGDGDQGGQGGQGGSGQGDGQDGDSAPEQGSGLSSTVLPSEAAKDDPGQAERDWQQQVATAAQAAKSIGKLPGAFQEMIDAMFTPAQIPWQAKLRQFAVKSIRAGACYSRPSRHYGDSQFFRPAKKSKSVKHLAFVVDTSGSMSQAEMNLALGELKDILRAYPKAKVTLIQCDAAVADVIELDYSSDWNVAIKDWKGRGGTDMRPAFEHAATLKPQGLICLSDMEIGAFPDAPRFPVFWLATRDHEKPPYGEMSILTVK